MNKLLFHLISILSIFLLTIATTFSQGSPAISKADSLGNLLKTDVEDTNKLNHLNELSLELMYQNPDTAITLGEQALALGAKIISNTSSQKNNAINKAAQKGVAKANGHLGIFYYLKGEYSISLKYHFISLELKESLNDKYGISNSLNNIGIVFRNQGDHAKALEYYFKALKINIELGDKKKIAFNLNNIGLVYTDQKDYPKALDNFKNALKLNEQLDNKPFIATNLNNIGIVYYHEANYKKALENYFKALKVNLEIENSNEVANNYTNIGAAYDKAGDFPQALEYYSKALQLNQELGNKYGITLSMGNVGSVYIQEKNYTDAEKFLLEALKISTEIEALELIKEDNELLSKVYASTNRYQLAYEHNLAFNVAKDSLFNEDKSKEIGRLEMRHEIEQMEAERIRSEEARLRTATEKRQRKNLLQYSGMTIGLLVIGLMIILLGFVKVSPPMARSVTFFSFLLFFEFILLLIDPIIDRYSGGEPVYKLIINASVALCIFPLNSALERIIKSRLTKKNAATKA